MPAAVLVPTKTTCWWRSHVKWDLVGLTHHRNFVSSFQVIPSLCVHSLGNSCSSLPVLDEERFNDLEKYIWSVSNHDISFDHFHLCAALTTDHVSDASAMCVLSNGCYLCDIAELPGWSSSELQNQYFKQIFNLSFKSNKNNFPVFICSLIWCMSLQSLKMTEHFNLKFFGLIFLYSWMLYLPIFLLLSTHVHLFGHCLFS